MESKKTVMELKEAIIKTLDKLIEMDDDTFNSLFEEHLKEQNNIDDFYSNVTIEKWTKVKDKNDGEYRWWNYKNNVYPDDHFQISNNPNWGFPRFVAFTKEDAEMLCSLLNDKENNE